MPYRDEDAKRHLKVTGDLGQVVFLVNDQSIFNSNYLCFLFLLRKKNVRMNKTSYKRMNGKCDRQVAIIESKKGKGWREYLSI